MSFSIRINRKKAGITQAELSKKLGVASHTVWRWENGERQPNIETSKKIAEILGCTLDDLFAENPTRPRPKKERSAPGRKARSPAQRMVS